MSVIGTVIACIVVLILAIPFSMVGQGWRFRLCAAIVGRRYGDTLLESHRVDIVPERVCSERAIWILRYWPSSPSPL
jgi:hypothetical protein